MMRTGGTLLRPARTWLKLWHEWKANTAPSAAELNLVLATAVRWANPRQFRLLKKQALGGELAAVLDAASYTHLIRGTMRHEAAEGDPIPLLEEACSRGLAVPLSVYNSMVAHFASEGDLGRAMRALSMILSSPDQDMHPEAASFDPVMKLLNQAGVPRSVVGLYRKLEDFCVPPTPSTLLHVAEAAALLKDPDTAFEVIDRLHTLHLRPTHDLCCALLLACREDLSRLESAWQLVQDSSAPRSGEMYSVLVCAYAEHDPEAALHYFHQMRQEALVGTTAACSTAMALYNKRGRPDLTLLLQRDMQHCGMDVLPSAARHIASAEALIKNAPGFLSDLSVIATAQKPGALVYADLLPQPQPEDLQDLLTSWVELSARELDTIRQQGSAGLQRFLSTPMHHRRKHSRRKRKARRQPKPMSKGLSQLLQEHEATTLPAGMRQYQTDKLNRDAKQAFAEWRASQRGSDSDSESSALPLQMHTQASVTTHAGTLDEASVGQPVAVLEESAGKPASAAPARRRSDSRALKRAKVAWSRLSVKPLKGPRALPWWARHQATLSLPDSD